MTPPPDRPSWAALRLAQTLYDLWFDDRGQQHDGYPAVVVDLGGDRAGTLRDVTYDDVANLLYLHVREDDR